MATWLMGTFRGRRKAAAAVSEPRPAPVTRESATKAACEEAARAWEEEERREHEEWLAAGQAGAELIAETCRRQGYFFPSDVGRGLPTIDLGDGQSVDLDEWSRRRRWRRAR